MKTEEPAFFWQITEFANKEERNKWIERYDAATQWHEVFVHNAYAIEHRKLKVIDI